MRKLLTPEEVRRHMPVTRDWIYADSAATTPVPLPVQEAMAEYFNQYGVNVDRGIYTLSHVAARKCEQARQRIAAFLGCEPEGFVFTRNCTEAINQVAYSLEHRLLQKDGDGFASAPPLVSWRPGDNLVTTISEHHSNFMPWLRLAHRLGLEVRLVEPDREGLLRPDAFARKVDERTRFAAVQHVSNVTGCIHPLREVIAAVRARKPDLLVLVDGSQAVGHMPVCVKDHDCDFYAFSGHKGLLGPQGSGGLCVRGSLLSMMEPMSVGGGTIDSVEPASYALRRDHAWKRFEAGTPAIPNFLGLGRAVEYVADEIGIERVREREEFLMGILLSGLAGIEDVKVYGPGGADGRGGVLSFNIKGYSCIDVALALEEKWKVLVRAGHHCCMNLARFLGVDRTHGGSVRISLGYFNTEEEGEAIVSAVRTLAHG